MTEIDVSKAFTAAFVKIKKIPIFSEFDSFIPYDNSPIQDLNLYVVKTNTFDLFFNKRYNLCYGMFLNRLTNIEITAYKQPSFIKDVKYSDIVNHLYKHLHISDDKELETYIKKLIGNINFGLLEKSCNKKVMSHIYDTLEEAREQQVRFGGTINTLQQFMETEKPNINNIPFHIH